MGADSHTNYALRKNGLQKTDYIHPELSEALQDVLGQTHGLIVYQEQVMSIAQKLAGFTLAQADLLRPRDGQEEEIRARQAVRGLQRRHAGARVLG
jgi:DNA polymerase-3 subunit alpha